MDEEIRAKQPSEIEHPAPIAPQERISSMDILRGTAVLGILAMNIYSFGLPASAYSNPFAYGGTDPVNIGTWLFTYVFFNQKFMSIFSMLFGAGLVVMYQRFQEKGQPLKKIYYRRIRWLILLGVIHAFFIWHGDILLLYGICGLLIFFFRKLSPKALIIDGLLALAFGFLIIVGIGAFFIYAAGAEERIEDARLAGEEPEEIDIELQKMTADQKEAFNPAPEDLRENIEEFRNGIGAIMKNRARLAAMTNTNGLLFFGLWRAGSMMLLGMGFFKLGIFSAERSRRFYLTMLMIAYAIGLPLVYYGGQQLLAHEYDYVYKFAGGKYYNYLGSVLIALGHVGVVMLFCKSNLLPKLKNALSSVGRMALTNYLTHSIVFTLIFYGYGLGLFARFERFELMFFVLGMWIVQLVVSPIWLRHFRFGPAEWLWRSLTYKKKQQMRV
ncbi:MAG TPA: DUF418 domain-containing protein [candidate division Zixibacteria bacterium]|nr:DUF418 domain-containing protein [candidate division Zixibacteria bacterium]